MAILKDELQGFVPVEQAKDIIKGIRIKYINNYLELYNELF